MGAALGLTRTDHTSGELRALSSKCPDSAQVRRLLALALVIDGRPRGEAAALAGMDRQTLCDWVHRYNASGVEGLKSRCPPGRVPALTEQQSRVARIGRQRTRSSNRQSRSLALRGSADRRGAAVFRNGACAHHQQVA